MKIVIFTHYYKGGGAEKRATVYANYFYENGLDITLVSAYKPEGEYYLNPGIPRHNFVDSFDEYKKMSKIKRLIAYKNILKELKPDIVFSFMTTYAAYSILATKFTRRLRKVKNIYCVALYQRRYNLLNRLVDIFVCLFSNTIFLQCKEQIKCNWAYKRKCIVNYNPIEDKWKTSIYREYNKLKIMSAGRLTKQKNFSLAIKGVVKAHSINPNISLDIFGIGPFKTKLLKQIASLNADDYIKIYDFSNNIVEEYKNHNVFVLSSKFEGFPNALAEAMMSGLLCISTKCPSGPKEMITNNENGFFFKTSEDLSNILISLLRNEEKCLPVSKEARATALSLFERDTVLAKLLDNLK